MKDKLGREYARLSQLKAGDVVELDDGFDCMKGRRAVIWHDGLCVVCREGLHNLTAQKGDDGDSLVGVYQT